MKDTLITLFFLCFLIILMPKRKKDNKTKKRKKRRSKKKSKRIENFTDFNNIQINQQKNIYDEPLKPCSMNPITGYHRKGYCFTDDMDQGTHTVCARVNDEFLDYTKSKGNDLTTRNETYNFPGLKDGDNWCLCALRWKQALKDGKAPPLNLEATNKKTLEYIDLDILEKYEF
jgi:uncharacterized protein (DUF2237 family)